MTKKFPSPHPCMYNFVQLPAVLRLPQTPLLFIGQLLTCRRSRMIKYIWIHCKVICIHLVILLHICTVYVWPVTLIQTQQYKRQSLCKIKIATVLFMQILPLRSLGVKFYLIHNKTFLALAEFLLIDSIMTDF